MKKGCFFKKEYFDRQVIFIAAVILLMVLYYINPLENTNLETWDRTFCNAMGGGISVAKRIRNFYVSYVFLPPVLMAVFSCLAGRLLYGREEYKRALVMMDTVLVIAVIAAYISRYRAESANVIANPLVMISLVYQLLLLLICVFDKHEILTAERIVFLYISYLTAIVTNILLVPRMGINKSILVASVLFLPFLAVLFRITQTDKNVCEQVEKVLSCWMWIPFVDCVILGGLYLLNEKGVEISRYNTVIRGSCLAYAVISLCVVLFWRGKKRSFHSFGYLGTAMGFGAVVYMPYLYFESQYMLTDQNHIYETGNLAFAIDTIQKGKLPIVDYFSAHALSDTLPSILYALIHADPKGALANPYVNLPEFLGLIVVFFLIKKLFGKDRAILFTCLFPFCLGLIKVTGICMVVLLAMIYALECRSSKAYLCFWLTALIGAFVRYDDGINLGVGCIAALLCILLLQKDKTGVKHFVLSGGLVAAAAMVSYFLYCRISGIHAVSRIFEWLSLTAGSNSTWAMNEFGDISSFAFFISYIVVPLCAAAVFVIVIISFAGNRQYPVNAAMVIAFSVCGMMFLPRTIVYHNLANSGGRTGVLLNFIHWTIAMLVLYQCMMKKRAEEMRFAAWIAAFGLTLIAEGAVVTGCIPNRDASLYNLAADYAWERKEAVSDNMSGIWGMERIILPDETAAFCTQFDMVFHVLLEEDETFLDFANITALYAFVGRERPFYVTQSPSLLTDLRSQQYYLEEVSSHKVPLAIIGNTSGSGVLMAGVSHNIRYYPIAEYIYRNYRPLVYAGNYVIWCELERYEDFVQRLTSSGLVDHGYELAQYKDDLSSITQDPNGENPDLIWRYHEHELAMAAYIWANNDKYHAIGNTILEKTVEEGNNAFSFSGSQLVDSAKGNYIAFEIDNTREDISLFTAVFEDSSDTDVQYQCSFSVLPGSNTYIIRPSQDYFWFVYNIDTIRFPDTEEYHVHNVRILEGD